MHLQKVSPRSARLPAQSLQADPSRKCFAIGQFSASCPRISVPHDSPTFNRKWIHNVMNCLASCFLKMYQPFPKLQILNFSKLTEFADYNSKFHEKVRKFFKWVENSVGNKEIASYK